MSSIHFTPVCGIYCGDCQFLGKTCEGCEKVKGRPFWTVQMPSGICQLNDCCTRQKKLEHCGLCEEFPCKTFLHLRDPNMRDEEFQKSIVARHESLKRRARIGTERWLGERGGGKEAV
jgi:hypothetical protein